MQKEVEGAPMQARAAARGPSEPRAALSARSLRHCLPLAPRRHK